MTKEFFDNGKKIAKWADNNMKQHKWHKEIKAWADGAEIECKDGHAWWFHENPDWSDKVAEYRIKPQPVEPQYLYVYANNDSAPRFFWNEITPLKTDLTYQGKIPLIVESNDD